MMIPLLPSAVTQRCKLLRPDDSISDFWLIMWFALLFLGMSVLALIRLLHAGNTANFETFMHYLSGITALLLALRTRKETAYLADIARVLLNQQAPRQIWRQNLYGILRDLMVQYVIASAMLAVISGLIASTWTVLTPVMWISLTSMLICAMSLVHRGLLFSRYNKWMIPGTILLLLVGVFGNLFNDLSAWLYRLPVICQILLSLSWPLFLMGLFLHFYNQIPVAKNPDSAQFLLALTKHIHRYRLIESVTTQGENKRFSGIFSSQFPNVIPIVYFTPTILEEGSKAIKTPAHIFWMLMVAVMATTMLVARDVHWRYMLAPGKIRQSLANHILISSLIYQGVALTVGVLMYELYSCLWNGSSFLEFVKNLPDCWLLPFEWILINALAIYVTSLSRTGYWTSVQTISLLTACAVAFTLSYLTGFDTPLFAAGPVYAASLLLLSYLLMRINNRRWTRELLLERIR